MANMSTPDSSVVERKHRYWMGHRQGECSAVLIVSGAHGFTVTCDRPSTHDGAHKDAGTGRTW